jgi:hypothetical protein
MTLGELVTLELFLGGEVLLTHGTLVRQHDGRVAMSGAVT